MPYKVRKKRGHDCYKVTNTETGQVMAECATREKAYAQVRLLEELHEKKQDEKKQVVKIHTLSDEQLETKDNTKKIIKVKKKDPK